MATIVIATLVITAALRKLVPRIDGPALVGLSLAVAGGLASVAIATDGVTMNAYCYGGEWKTLGPVI